MTVPGTAVAGGSFGGLEVHDSSTGTPSSYPDPSGGLLPFVATPPAATVVVEPARYAAVLALIESSAPALAADPHDSTGRHDDTSLAYGDDPYLLRPGESARTTFDAYLRVTEKAYSPLLSDALSDLEQVDEEAREDGSPIPSPLAHGNARRLLERMFRIRQIRYSLYPLHDGEIVIEARSARGSVLVVCRSDGGIGCSARIDGESRTERYYDVSGLPNDFMRYMLRELTGLAGRTE